jgi:para-nitrobenzyl esterase
VTPAPDGTVPDALPPTGPAALPGVPPSVPPVAVVAEGTLAGVWAAPAAASAAGGAAPVAAFLGVPYAAAPVGDLRWRAPAPPPPWRGVRPAAAYGPACPQPDVLARLFGGTLGPTSEDCLTLNVWTAALAPGAPPAPVLVFVHGGSFFLGWSASPLYDGAALARRGLVVVTINYRLGPLGFLAHPALSAEPGAAHNLALLDVAAALRWVRANARAFGGDPARVTACGESAGAHAVGLLLASPVGAGLADRAILQSGGGVGHPLLPLRDPDPGADTAESRGAAVATAAGLDGARATAAELRALPVDALLAATPVTSPEPYCLPVVDGRVVAEPPEAAFASGRAQAVPLLVGINDDEGTVLWRDPPAADLAAYREFLAARFRQDPDDLLRHAPARTDADVLPSWQRLMGTVAFEAPARWLARTAAARGTPVWFYHFTRVGDAPPASALGAFHASELPFVFGTLDRAPALWGRAAYDAELSDRMGAHWAAFAASGDPNTGGPDAAGRAAWPAYDADDDQCLTLGAAVRAAPCPRRAACDAWAPRFDARARGATLRSARDVGAALPDAPAPAP